MFGKVLVGVDGQFGGRDAIALASSHGSRRAARARARLSRAGRSTASRPRRRRGPGVCARARPARRRAQGGRSAGELRWSARTAPGRGLHELAESLGSDLLVVGSSVRGLLGRVLVGDDTRAALDGAPCAVAVAPVGYAKHANAIRRIGVGYDGCSDSVRALDVARALAQELDASLAALEVVAYPACVFRAPDAGDNASVRELISDARDRVASIGDVEATVPTVMPPRSSRAGAKRSTCSWSDRAATAPPGGSCTGARLAHSSKPRAVPCSC